MPSRKPPCKSTIGRSLNPPSFPWAKIVKTANATSHNDATFEHPLNTSVNANALLLQLPLELRLMIWRDIVFVKDNIVRPRQIYRTNRQLKGAARARAYQSQTFLRSIVSEEDGTLPQTWNTDLRKRERIDPLWPAFACRQMYAEITPLYYSNVHYSLLYPFEILSPADRNLLEMLQRPRPGELLKILGAHNTRYIQQLTLACGDHSSYRHFYTRQAAHGLTLPHYTVMTTLHILAVSIQEKFPSSLTVHCNVTVDSCTYELTVDPSRRLTGPIRHTNQLWNHQADSSLYEILNVLHGFSQDEEDVEAVANAFDELFCIFLDVDPDEERENVLTSEQWIEFLRAKTRHLLHGDELKALEGTKVMPLGLGDDGDQAEEDEQMKVKKREESCEEAVASARGKRAQSPLLDQSVLAEEPSQNLLQQAWGSLRTW